MANAADYLILDTTQLINTYKLRTRSIQSRTFVARNSAPNYILSAVITSNLDGVVVTPGAFKLQPDESITVSVEYDTNQLEVYPAGTLEGSLDIAVSANPVVIPQIPVAPPAPELPEAPRQIVSRIQVTPSNFTLSEVNEANNFDAVLYVDDVPTPATFQWSLENNKSNAFSINSSTGIVKALSNGVTKATVKVKVITPKQYVGTEGLAIVASNIAVVVPVGGAPVPTTGNLTVIVNGMTRNIGASVTISGINQSITQTTTFNNIPAGNYTITPNVVTAGGVNYNPVGGGEIYVAPGQNAEVTIQYTKQLPPDVNSIQIVTVSDSAGNVLQPGQRVKTGERIVVVANTYRNGIVANIGDVQFTANNTQEGVQTIQSRSDGTYKVLFTVTQPGEINITAFNQSAGSVTGQLSATRATEYSIRLVAPSTLILGQSSPLTAVVLQDGVETNIPVEIEIASGTGTISSKRPAELRTQPPVTPPQEQPTFVAATEAAQTGTATGGTIVDTSAAGTSGGVSTGGEFDQIAFINQGQNAI